MVEAQMQPLLRELSEKRELLHQAYVLATAPSATT